MPVPQDSAKLSDRPAFEVRGPDNHYKIWADGRIEGFGKSTMIINRIPVLMARQEVAFLDMTKEERKTYFKERCST